MTSIAHSRSEERIGVKSRSFLRHVTLQVDGFVFIGMGSFFAHHGDPRVAVKIIFVVLSTMIDKKILLLTDEF